MSVYPHIPAFSYTIDQLILKKFCTNSLPLQPSPSLTYFSVTITINQNMANAWNYVVVVPVAWAWTQKWSGRDRYLIIPRWLNGSLILDCITKRTAVFWVLTACNLTDQYQHFEEICRPCWKTTAHQQTLFIQSLVGSYLAPSVHHKVCDEVCLDELLHIFYNEMEIRP